jgi:hypothetical protein
MLLYHYYPKLHGCGTKNLLFARFFFYSCHAVQDCIQNTLRPSILRQGLFYGRLIIACFLLLLPNFLDTWEENCACGVGKRSVVS